MTNEVTHAHYGTPCSDPTCSVMKKSGPARYICKFCGGRVVAQVCESCGQSRLRARPSLLNQAEVRRRLIQCAGDNRFYWRSVKARVSQATLDKIEAGVEADIRNIAEKLPSKGMTI
jgi:hypothetical protein